MRTMLFALVCAMGVASSAMAQEVSEWIEEAGYTVTKTSDKVCQGCLGKATEFVVETAPTVSSTVGDGVRTVVSRLPDMPVLPSLGGAVR